MLGNVFRVARWAALASRLSIGVARLLSPLFGYADAYASRGSQIGCAGFGFATLPHFIHRGSQIAKTLTSFRVLPFGLAWASLKSRPKSVMFASLSTDFVELTSSVLLAPRQIHKEPPLRGGSLCIGVARFELTTFCSQSRRSTRLSYTPKWQQI